MFPVRYELDLYILFGINSILERLTKTNRWKIFIIFFRVYAIQFDVQK
jgi:hypothetical protein